MVRLVALAALALGVGGTLQHLQHRNARNLAPGPVAVRSLIGHGSRSALNSTMNSTALYRPMPTESLKEWKHEATECLTWCGSLKQSCFRGCLDDCIRVLQAPKCTKVVLTFDTKCTKSCKDL